MSSLTDRLKAALACPEQNDYKFVRDKWPGAPGSSADYYTRGRFAERARTSAIEAALIAYVEAGDALQVLDITPRAAGAIVDFSLWEEFRRALANLEREIVGME